MDINDIAEVDFVIGKDGKGILDVVNEKFDYLLASHESESRSVCLLGCSLQHFDGLRIFGDI